MGISPIFKNQIEDSFIWLPSGERYSDLSHNHIDRLPLHLQHGQGDVRLE